MIAVAPSIVPASRCGPPNARSSRAGASSLAPVVSRPAIPADNDEDVVAVWTDAIAWLPGDGENRHPQDGSSAQSTDDESVNWTLAYSHRVRFATASSDGGSLPRETSAISGIVASAPPLRPPASIRVLALVSRESSARLRIEQTIAIAAIRCSRSCTTRSPRHRLDRTIGPVPLGGGADALLAAWLPPSRSALRAARGLAAGLLAPGLCPDVPAILQPLRRILNIAALPRLRDYP
ncbi:MAG: hypothetical protein K0R44_2949 [Thermomicrobiales bacterium]|nr:hypothetical protein [Thermomicrobiales bacterium]